MFPGKTPLNSTCCLPGWLQSARHCQEDFTGIHILFTCFGLFSLVPIPPFSVIFHKKQLIVFFCSPISCSLCYLSSKPKSHSLFSFASCRNYVPLTSAAVRCLDTGFCRCSKFTQLKKGLNKVRKKICLVLLIRKIWHQEIPELCEWSITTDSLASFLGIHHSQLSETGY